MTPEAELPVTECGVVFDAALAEAVFQAAGGVVAGGALLALAWPGRKGNGENRTQTALASGFIAGEAIIAVIVPILVTIGILHLK